MLPAESFLFNFLSTNADLDRVAILLEAPKDAVTRLIAYQLVGVPYPFHGDGAGSTVLGWAWSMGCDGCSNVV